MSDFLFDTHTHLDLCPNFEETVSEIERRKIYTIAVTNLPALYRQLSNKLKSNFIRPALGFHPELIGQFEKYIPEMWNSLPNARFIGEVGIDLKVSKESEKIQIEFFTELILRCNQLGGKILTIHSRGSAQRVVDIIGDNFNGKFILHWYSGDMTTLKKALRNGAYFSINFAMVKSKSGRKIIDEIPLDRLLLESDAPFIRDNQDKILNTLNIDLVVQEIALLKNIEYLKLRKALYDNFKKMLTF